MPARKKNLRPDGPTRRDLEQVIAYLTAVRGLLNLAETQAKTDLHFEAPVRRDVILGHIKAMLRSLHRARVKLEHLEG